jgi:DNA-binding beta-propeller fold protein YncE
VQVERTIPVPQSPHEILVTPDSRVAYVSCMRSGKIAAIDLSGWRVKQLIDAGTDVDGLAWASPH